MNILAMDTTSLTATVSVINEQKTIGEFSVTNKLTHSQIIMPMLDTMLKTSAISLDDIDVYAVSIGPGSFTGLRIGMASVKTLAQAKQKPIIGVSALEAISQNFGYTDCIVCPMIDARRNEVYNALYQNGDCIVKERAITIEELLEQLRGLKVIFAGDGAIVHREVILSHTNENWSIAPPNLILPKASSVAAVALKRALNEDFDDVYTLNPIYLKKSQAERELEEKINRGNKNDSNWL